MHIRFLSLVAIAFVVTPCQASRTIMVPRSVVTDPATQYTLHYYNLMTNKTDTDTFNWSLHITPFYQSSTRSKKLAQYLLPYNSTCLSVQEDGTGNIGSPWLYLIGAPGSRVRSTLYMTPQFQKCGALLDVRFNFDNLARGWWFNALIVPGQAINQLHLCEQSLEATGAITGYHTVLDALNNYGTQYVYTKTTACGVDDIVLKCGYSFKKRDRWTAEGYLAVTCPTSNHQKGCYFFEPQLGNGGHAGVGVGASWVVNALNRDKKLWAWIADLNYQYLFKRNQCRAFDLTNGDWSRYLLVAFQEVPEIGLPLLPLMVRCANVHPGSQVSFFNVLHHQHNNWQVEFGANIWWRRAETVYPDCKDFGTLGIYDLLGMRLGIATSTSNATIDQTSGSKNSVVSDTTFTPLTISKINACSGAQPRAFTAKFIGALGYESTDHACPVSCGVGGWYEVSNTCAALNQWGIGLHLSVLFN